MSAMGITTSGSTTKKIRSGRRPTVQDAGIAAARMRRNGNGHDASATPSMIPATPIVPTAKSEDRMRIDALEAELAGTRKKLALLEDTIEYLRIHSAWPSEWVLAHGGEVEPGPDDVETEASPSAEQETVEIKDGDASPATLGVSLVAEATSEAKAEPEPSELSAG